MSKEQHPVDKIFGRKLGQLEATPSAEAWNRLQAGLNQKKDRKKALIWLPYASAAAVVLLLGALWLLTGRQTNKIQPKVAVQTGSQAEIKNRVATQMPDVKRNEQNQINPDTPATESSTTETALEKLNDPAERISPAQLAKNRPARKAEKFSSTEPAQKLERKDIPVPAPAPEEQLAKQTIDKIAPAVTSPQSEDQVLVVVVQIPEAAIFNTAKNNFGEDPEESETVPRTRTGKLLESLKKVKQAEFRELGLTADNVMARFRDKNEK